ncbi:hypothetical protein EJ05DRAFT_489117 [Pseudovirgaria hyperparasitica]|uniref:Uncharacterized protein n=1 Tax=Pseudovirgaria hyperparasitica TaxID=470096 RepID=A0A6A6VX63_9PEZI|nr:uncharacterized protein EJ05DRAFT_489117 [Pseudovirgaria hyperparasitica]KAF2754396.1 hypothetical protein EJ05DRAFT_489117 [Pseudovirgaria hyperparasitica]
MAPKVVDTTTSDTAVTFTEKEMFMLASAWQCMSEQPKIDMDKLAKICGYTAGSCSVTFGKLKRKIKALGDSNSDITAAPPSTPKSGGRKRKPKENEGEESPTKKVRNVKAPAKVDPEEESPEPEVKDESH